MAMFVEFGDAESLTLKSLAAWLPPMRVTGCGFYLTLSVGCS
jgi:hypothetical protein